MMAKTLTCDEQLERSTLAGPISWALEKCRRNNNCKYCGIWWLFLSNTDLLKREYNKVTSINQQSKTKCGSHQSFLIVFKDFCSYRTHVAEGQAQDLILRMIEL